MSYPQLTRVTSSSATTRSPSTETMRTVSVLSLPHDVAFELAAYLDMRVGWDRETAPAPNAAAVGHAARLLEQWFTLRLAGGAGNSYEMAPSLDGGVNLVFDRRDRWVSLSCRNDGQVEIERSDREEFVVDAADSSTAVARHLRWVLGT